MVSVLGDSFRPFQLVRTPLHLGSVSFVSSLSPHTTNTDGGLATHRYRSAALFVGGQSSGRGRGEKKPSVCVCRGRILFVEASRDRRPSPVGGSQERERKDPIRVLLLLPRRRRSLSLSLGRRRFSPISNRGGAVRPTIRRWDQPTLGPSPRRTRTPPASAFAGPVDKSLPTSERT